MARTIRNQALDVVKAREAFDRHRDKQGITYDETIFLDLQTGINKDRAEYLEGKDEQAAFDQYGEVLDTNKAASGQLAKAFDKKRLQKMMPPGRIASIERVLQVASGSLVVRDSTFGYSYDIHESDVKPSNIFVKHIASTDAAKRTSTIPHSFDVEVVLFDTEVEYDDPIQKIIYTASLGIREAWLHISAPKQLNPVFSEAQQFSTPTIDSATITRMREENSTESKVKWQIKSTNGEPLKGELKLAEAIQLRSFDQPTASFTIKGRVAAITLNNIATANVHEKVSAEKSYEIHKSMQKLLLEKEAQRQHGPNQTSDWVIEQIEFCGGVANENIT